MERAPAAAVFAIRRIESTEFIAIIICACKEWRPVAVRAGIIFLREGHMSVLRTSVFVLALGAGIAITTAADAAPRILFRGCAFFGMPGCTLMRATDGKVYQLLNLDPAFTPYSPVVVYANPAVSPGLCFAPAAKVRGWKPNPKGTC